MLSSRIRLRATRFALGAGALFLGAVLGLVLNGGWLLPSILGASPQKASDVSADLAAGRRTGDYIDIEGNAVVDSGIVYSKNLDDPNAEVEKYVLLLSTGDRMVVVTTSEPTSAVRFRGKVTELDAELTRELGFRGPDRPAQLDENLIPLTIDATTDWRIRGAAWASMAALAAAVGMAGLVRFGPTAVRPSRDRRLAAVWGADSERFVAEVDAETDGPSVRQGKAVVTTRFLIDRKAAVAVPFGEVVWAYPKATTQRVNGIKAGTTHSVVVKTTLLAKDMEIAVKDPAALMDLIGHQAPWAILGYGPDLVHTWNTSEEYFVNAVAERRRAILPSYPHVGGFSRSGPPTHVVSP